MRNSTTITRGTVGVYATATALVAAVVALAAIWGGAPLAAIPWVISMIVGANIALSTHSGPAWVATLASVTVTSDEASGRAATCRRPRNGSGSASAASKTQRVYAAARADEHRKDDAECMRGDDR